METNKRSERNEKRKKKTDENKRESVAQDHLTGIMHSDPAAGEDKASAGPICTVCPHVAECSTWPRASVRRPFVVVKMAAFDPEPTVHL